MLSKEFFFDQRLGKSYDSITHCLAKEGYATTKAGVYKFSRQYEETATILQKPGNGQAKKLTAEAKRIVDEQMSRDDETTGRKLKKQLVESGIHVATSTAIQWRMDNTNETTVQIETHRGTCCYKSGQKPRYKPKSKHPVKVHVWAGISH